ncbi:MAG: hypothetical protein QXM07_09465 [Nitrososphaerota archaeon]
MAKIFSGATSIPANQTLELRADVSRFRVINLVMKFSKASNITFRFESQEGAGSEFDQANYGIDVESLSNVAAGTLIQRSFNNVGEVFVIKVTNLSTTEAGTLDILCYGFE